MRAWPSLFGPEWHLRIQAAMQRHVDAAVSKTVNLPASATVDDIRGIFVAAWRARVKGITVYRDGGKPGRVLTLLSPGATTTRPAMQVDADFSGGCAVHVCEF